MSRDVHACVGQLFTWDNFAVMLRGSIRYKHLALRLTSIKNASLPRRTDETYAALSCQVRDEETSYIF